ncbi:MAG: ABC transporter permease, partial [Phycisphaerae bacterium]
SVQAGCELANGVRIDVLPPLYAVRAFLGLAGGIGYAWLMLAGLRSVDWWAEAVHAPFLELHVSWGSLLIGYAASFAIALGSIAGSVRGLTRQSPRSLLAGAIQSGRAAASPHRTRRAWMLLYGSLLCGVGALMSALATDAIPEVYAFFTGGTALLIAGLAGASLWLQDDRHLPIRSTGPGTLVRLGLRNAARCRGRSLTTMALIACSTFVIIAVGASRHEAGHEAQARQGGTGGFTLMGEAAIPLPYNLNTPTGRDALNVGAEAARLLDNSKCVSLRMRPGDDTSCLNLYRAGRPKILGASEEMIERGGFSFSRSLAETTAEAANPWRLLDRTFQDGAVPMIGDANTLQYLLKIGLGDALTLTDERGRERRLRVVGMLSGSVLQGALVIAERRFTGLFPSISGHGFLLIEAPPESSEALARALERDLGGYDLDVVSTLRQLNTYRAVENTYMSTFQALGGLGLMLGTLGLGAILLRNVFDRRGELALLRALGFRPARLMGMVLVENAALLIGSVGIGSLAALLAVAPHMVDRAEQIPWPSLAGTLLIVIGVGLVAGTVALVASFKTPLLPALRTE